MSLETGQILQDIGLSATISQLGAKSALWRLFLAHELLGGVSQEVVENDLQTDPENHLHQPHLNTPIITLSPPQ